MTCRHMKAACHLPALMNIVGTLLLAVLLLGGCTIRQLDSAPTYTSHTQVTPASN